MAAHAVAVADRLRHDDGVAGPNPYRTFRSLSASFHDEYFRWHSTGQYDGVQEFGDVADVLARPPARERDDSYAEELRVLDRHFRRLSDSRVLEIGCGDGNLTWKLARRCRALVARDLDPAAIALTARRLRELAISNVTLESRAGEDAAAADLEAYDVVFFVQVLEHVPHWEQGAMFDAVFSLVAPGGCLFVSTPNRWSLIDAHDTNKPLIHWLPRRIKVPLAKAMKWGLPCHDPAWPYPPVLHDYVSFRWMLRRARRAWPSVTVSQMSFFPTADQWRIAKNASCGSRPRALARHLLSAAAHIVPLNYYFGDKVIFQKTISGR